LKERQGGSRNRTGVHGFAGRCMTTLPSRQSEEGRSVAVGFGTFPRESGAGNESRTRDLNLGKADPALRNNKRHRIIYRCLLGVVAQCATVGPGDAGGEKRKTAQRSLLNHAPRARRTRAFGRVLRGVAPPVAASKRAQESRGGEGFRAKETVPERRPFS
jgi:hypothetical protein